MAWEARAKSREYRASNADMVLRWVRDVLILLLDAELVIIDEFFLGVPGRGTKTNDGLLQKSIFP